MSLRRSVVEPFFLALSFLTRLPVDSSHTASESFPRSLFFFPVVGLLLGAILGAVAWLVRGLPASLLWAALLVALLAAITGALHLDGVADFFDALGGGRGDANRMLEIMRDSRIGAHGATAICLLVVAKVNAFDYALAHFDLIVWLLLPTVSRTAVVPVIAFFPVARQQGLAKTFHAAKGGTPATVVALLLTALVYLTAVDFILPLFVAFAVALVIAFWAKRRLGGLTGDIYGTSIEFSELAFIAAWIALRR
ncbi:MAG: adenosylcobinamide-GDP ribazoletransferase [Deltaproteobacteria bacterium]|nr:adenosylcobinamide-GDP ribazoletransferase [Deltaproteobacteria bacterium]